MSKELGLLRRALEFIPVNERPENYHEMWKTQYASEADRLRCEGNLAAERLERAEALRQEIEALRAPPTQQNWRATITLDFYAGEGINTAAGKAIALAQMAQAPVEFLFNGTKLIATPQDTPGAVMDRYVAGRQ